MASELIIKELRKGLYLLDEDREATGYLIEGNDKACLIDTMNGRNNLKKVADGLTDKPVIVVNTHGHPDHIYGNVYFESAYMHSADLALADEFINDPDFVKFMKDNNVAMPPFVHIEGGESIDLGGRTLKVYDCPGHTQGGILLLCPEERILFTGDSINHHLWMQLDCCTTVEKYIEVLESLSFLMDEADYILHGHATNFDDISLMRSLIDGLKEILAGKNQDDKVYYYFEGTAQSMYHPFEVQKDKEFERPDNVICYEPETIR